MIPVVIVGVGSGLGAVVFRKLISFFTTFFFHDYTGWTTFGFGSLTAPIIGALIFGPMIFLWAKEARGHGVPEVMEAVALKGGRIRPIVAVVKSLASSIDIGSGGAIGREGPIAQIGSALGSSLGQLLNFPERYLRLLVAAGAAGGIAATFNAPIAGALFGLELILREFSGEAFAAVGVASVLGVAVSIPFLGTKPFFILPAGAAMHSPWALVLFAVLGLFSAVIGTAFTRFLYWTEDIFNAWNFSEALKPAAGGLLLGIVITLLPSVRGLGYGVMAQVFTHHFALFTLGLLLFGKFLAATLTLGSGGSGGIFTPTLFMGTMLGAAFGAVAGHLFPTIAGSPAAYALVGAAAVFGSASRAPITAVVIVMEMSQNYVLALPLILAVLIAIRFSDLNLEDSIYTLKLVRRGVRIFQEKAVDLLQQIPVREAMLKDPPSISSKMPLADSAEALSAHHARAMPVAEGGDLQGIITVTDLEHAQEMHRQARTVADVMVTDVVVAYPEEPLREAVRRMGRADVGQLLVVDPDRPTHLLGLLRRVDIVKALQEKTGETKSGQPIQAPGSGEGSFVEAGLTEASPHVRKTLQQISFPRGVIVVSIQRGQRTLVPHGNTALMPDDRILLYVVPKEKAGEVRRFIETGAEPSPDGGGGSGGGGGPTAGFLRRLRRA